MQFSSTSNSLTSILTTTTTTTKKLTIWMCFFPQNAGFLDTTRIPMKVLSSAASKGAEAASAAKAAAGRAAEAVSKRTEDVMMARRERYIEVKQYLVELKDRSPLFKTSGWDKIHELWRHFFGMKKKEGGLEQVFPTGQHSCQSLQALDSQ